MIIHPPKVAIDGKEPFKEALFGREEFGQSLANLVTLLIVVFLLVGCRGRREDIEAMKKTYTDFRIAVLKKDYGAATNCMSSELVTQYEGREGAMIEDLFRTITNSDYDLKNDMWVRFIRRGDSDAFLFPHGVPVVGQGFVKETNGWKITVNVDPITGD